MTLVVSALLASLQYWKPRRAVWADRDLSFDLSEPEAYRHDVPKAEVHVLDAGHFALDTAADQIAMLIGQFIPVRLDRRQVAAPRIRMMDRY